MTTLCIAIDNLDECGSSDGNELLEALSSLTTVASNTRLFLASRENVSREIEKRFPSLDLVVGDPSLIEEIKQALVLEKARPTNPSTQPVPRRTPHYAA